MSFNGSMIGNITGILYFISFQIISIYCFLRIRREEGQAVTILMGSVFGSFFLHWLPILFSFFFGFTKTSHLLALAVLFIGACFITIQTKERALLPSLDFHVKRFVTENKIVWLIVPMFFFFCYLLFTHTIQIKDGVMYTGQATYGDMSMHLGFITSIAEQGKHFPPEYNLLPGTRLSYPFLCDSISSSLYLFGTSLRLSYNIPMYVAILQVMIGFYCFVKTWLESKSKAIYAWILFFLNGGLGFIYFLNWESIKQNFTDFYFTPTSLGKENIRWAQVVVNMLLPQRATLFGWAILFPLLVMLYQAVKKKRRRYFFLSAVLAGGLPMIHTHSFLALGLICTMWLIFDLKERTETYKKNQWLRNICYIGLLFFCMLQQLNEKNQFADRFGLTLVLTGVMAIIIWIITLLYQTYKKGQLTDILRTWGMFLLIVMVLALPQLVIWTFSQAGREGFVRSYFNWSNEGDFYLWFYVKNIGVCFLLFLMGVLTVKGEHLRVASPIYLIWFVAELVVFQPNPYDNNKLLFVAYVFMCGIAAEYIEEIKKRMKNPTIQGAFLCVIFFFSSIAGVLTMGREYVSKYELYNKEQIKLAEYIEQNLEPDAVVLTDPRHTNEVAVLSGRNIVCGAGTYLYFHGLDYEQREANLQKMYEQPELSQSLFHQYNVQYVLISNFERNTYPNLDEAYFEYNYEVETTIGDSTVLYKRK